MFIETYFIHNNPLHLSRETSPYLIMSHISGEPHE